MNSEATRLIDWLRFEKNILARLERTIIRDESRDYFLRLPKFWLSDVENLLLPRGWFSATDGMLALIHEKLLEAEGAVLNYGPNVQLIFPR